MPIEFEAPQPFSASISSGYGAAEQSSRDLPVLAGLYGQAANVSARANESAADNAYRGAAALGQQRLQAGEFQADQEARAREFDLHRQVAVEQANAQRFDQSLRLAEYQRRPEEMQRQFELKAELNNAELSQQENLRLKQLKEYQGAIDNMTEYSPAEKEDLKLQVQAKVSPLAARRAKFDALQAEQHAQLYKQQAMQHEEVTRQNAALDAKSLADRVTEIDMGDGTTAKLVQTGYDQNGRPIYTQLKSEKPAKTGELTQEQVAKHYHDSVEAVTKMIEANAKLEAEGKKSDPNIGWHNRTELIDQHFAALMSAVRGGAGTTAANGPNAQAARSVPPAAVEASGRKFDAALDAIQGNPAIPPAQKEQARLATDALKAAVRDYGTADPARVPEEARPGVQAAVNVLMGVAQAMPRPPGPKVRPLPGWVGYNPGLDAAFKRK